MGAAIETYSWTVQMYRNPIAVIIGNKPQFDSTRGLLYLRSVYKSIYRVIRDPTEW